MSDAKPRATGFYSAFGFTPIEGAREGKLHGDPVPMFLDIRTVDAAAKED